MDPYLLVKTFHVLSATVLFGTGLGIAFFFWMGGRAGDDRWRGGFDPAARWLVVTYALYLLAGACWLPVVWLQLRIRDQLAVKLAGGAFDPALHARYRRWWFVLGWPAFLGLVVVVHLMVSKPA